MERAAYASPARPPGGSLRALGRLRAPSDWQVSRSGIDRHEKSPFVQTHVWPLLTYHDDVFVQIGTFHDNQFRFLRLIGF